jgi:hypothetical protein
MGLLSCTEIEYRPSKASKFWLDKRHNSWIFLFVRFAYGEFWIIEVQHYLFYAILSQPTCSETLKEHPVDSKLYQMFARTSISFEVHHPQHVGYPYFLLHELIPNQIEMQSDELFTKGKAVS